MAGGGRVEKVIIQMSDGLLHTRRETKNGRNKAVPASGSPFRIRFALEERESPQIYPHTSGKSPQLVLPLASVAGLVVPCVEAELEDGGLHVVPLVLLLGRDVLHQLSRTHGLQLLRQEVTPFVPASLPRVGDAERAAPCGFRLTLHPSAAPSDGTPLPGRWGSGRCPLRSASCHGA